MGTDQTQPRTCNDVPPEDICNEPLIFTNGSHPNNQPDMTQVAAMCGGSQGNFTCTCTRRGGQSCVKYTSSCKARTQLSTPPPSVAPVSKTATLEQSPSTTTDAQRPTGPLVSRSKPAFARTPFATLQIAKRLLRPSFYHFCFSQ